MTEIATNPRLKEPLNSNSKPLNCTSTFRYVPRDTVAPAEEVTLSGQRRCNIPRRTFVCFSASISINFKKSCHICFILYILDMTFLRSFSLSSFQKNTHCFDENGMWQNAIIFQSFQRFQGTWSHHLERLRRVGRHKDTGYCSSTSQGSEMCKRCRNIGPNVKYLSCTCISCILYTMYIMYINSFESTCTYTPTT